MGITKTLGGDRLGSGNRMKQEMHDFYRSNKNLSKTFASTMAPGVLYPCYTQIALKGDTFDVDVNSFVRTIPTLGPLYGSFKLQIDMFQVPFRLYQAILHNNTTDIARKMNQVMLPQILLEAIVKASEYDNGFNPQINESALLRYLNISGVGKPMKRLSAGTSETLKREFLALPTLAYYDIFKNYYANKQEELAYVITPSENKEEQIGLVASVFSPTNSDINTQQIQNNALSIQSPQDGMRELQIFGRNLNPKEISLDIETPNNTRITGTVEELKNSGKISYTLNEDKTILTIIRTYGVQVDIYIELNTYTTSEDIHLQAFPLSNIDDMRKYLLTQWELGEQVVLNQEIGEANVYPYQTLFEKTNGRINNTYALNGLVVKCYQSDLFNNWLDTEWVNEITDTSAIDVSNGSFTLDMLNFKKKLYDHLNRLAISGGTYDDWQEATYGDKVWGKSEKPIYCGGMSAEVVFDEVISTAASQEQPLGSIAGQGQLTTRKSGNVTIKVGEASVIMAIVSLTPRLFYTQGNAWYNTELKTMDDLHKPIFDRIGFQDLIVEQMAWFDATAEETGEGQEERRNFSRSSAGKQPAWMQYATDIDTAYGDFAKKEGLNYMILARNYEQDDDLGNVKDVTTYIDPSKYNYAFANSNLSAQNFWTFIKFKIKARRKMSNTQIPNV